MDDAVLFLKQEKEKDDLAALASELESQDDVASHEDNLGVDDTPEAQDAVPRKSLSTLMAALDQDVPKKRPSGPVEMDLSRNWKRQKGDPLKHLSSSSPAASKSHSVRLEEGCPASEDLLPADSTTVGVDSDDEDGGQFHSADSSIPVDRQADEMGHQHSATGAATGPVNSNPETPQRPNADKSVGSGSSKLFRSSGPQITSSQDARRTSSNLPSSPSPNLPSNSSPNLPSSPPPNLFLSPKETANTTEREVLDHRGYLLSRDAINIAQAYWDNQRQFELCPFVAGAGFEQRMPSVDLLLQNAKYRQRYTELILGIHQMAPGTRTFEPPYMGPANQAPRQGVNTVADRRGSPVKNKSQASTPGHAGTSSSFLNKITDNNHLSLHNNNPSDPFSNFTDANSAGASNPASNGEASDTFVDADSQPAAGAITDPVLNEEQQHVVDLAAQGRNIFYTGSAGSGKSTVLHAIRKRLQEINKVVRVMAPTGRVALAINGTTTWTFAGWTPASYKKGIEFMMKTAQRNKDVKQRFRETDVVIIDEISMVDNLHFERLHRVMQAGRTGIKTPDGRACETLPFGGVQVIVTGDFFQLPPVHPFRECLCGVAFEKKTAFSGAVFTCPTCRKSYRENEKWAFQSDAWRECAFVCIQLGTIHRQRDPDFIAMLQKCRQGIRFTKREVNLLMNHESVTPHAVKLLATREEVQQTNSEAYQQVNRPPHVYHCLDTFKASAKHPHLNQRGSQRSGNTLTLLNDDRLEPIVELKQDMPVILLVNDIATGLANGSQGIVVGFEPYHPSKLPCYVGHGDRSAGGQVTTYPRIKSDNIKQYAEKQREGLAWPIVHFFCGVVRTVYPVCNVVEMGDASPYSLLSRTQVPLTAGYAMSIHKSQGLTMDRVVVNLSRVFQAGQVYVALSRATNLKGLKIEGDSKGLIVGMGDKEVKRFMMEQFGA